VPGFKKWENFMNTDDYGYFGKGTEGYIHYKQTFDSCFKNDTTPTHRKTAPSKTPASRTKEEPGAGEKFFCGCVIGCSLIVFLGWICFIVSVFLQ
jgi:hypothetical protein